MFVPLKWAKQTPLADGLEEREKSSCPNKILDLTTPTLFARFSVDWWLTRKIRCFRIHQPVDSDLLPFSHSSFISWSMAVFDVLFTTVVLAVLIAEGKIRWRLCEFVHQQGTSCKAQMMRKNDHEAFFSWSKSLKKLFKSSLLKKIEAWEKASPPKITDQWLSMLISVYMQGKPCICTYANCSWSIVILNVSYHLRIAIILKIIARY